MDTLHAAKMQNAISEYVQQAKHSDTHINSDTTHSRTPANLHTTNLIACEGEGGCKHKTSAMNTVRATTLSHIVSDIINISSRNVCKDHRLLN